MREMIKLMANTGVVSEDMLAEFKKWGVVPQDYSPPTAAGDLNSFLRLLTVVLEEENLVIIKETDVDALRQYLGTMEMGEMVLVTEEQSGNFPVTYGVLKTGEVLIPWRADTIEELIVNGKTHLITAAKEALYFNEVRELFFGDTKSFMACKVAIKETTDELGRALTSAT